MKLYKHYSFDLWMTLIRSNPAFKLERTKYFFHHYNRYEKTTEEIGIVFRQIDVMCNAINEKTGNSIPAEEMYLMVISAINNYHYPLHEVDLNALYDKMEQLLFAYLPVIYCEQTHRVLQTLKQAANSSFSLLSNTAFIKGSTLRNVLKQIGLGDFFDFQLYSDEEGMSKPNERFFKRMLEKVEHNGRQIARHEIVHVGDNTRADIGGADKAGINSILINSNHYTILNLLN